MCRDKPCHWEDKLQWLDTSWNVKKSGRHDYIVLDYEHRQTFFHTDGPDDLNSWLLDRLGNGRLWKHLSPSENFTLDVRSVR